MFQDEHKVVEKLLKSFVGEIDANLFETVVLFESIEFIKSNQFEINSKIFHFKGFEASNIQDTNEMGSLEFFHV